MTSTPNKDAFCPWASIYTPLDRTPSQVRFIEILPCDTEEDDVSCVLKVAELGPDTRYAALSYVWGDPEVTKDIIVNGIMLPVTTNLESALRQFRKTGFPKGCLEDIGEITQLWVDAICINQKDTKERNHQLTLMASIYNNATSVLSWLGLPDENHHDLQFQTIRELMCALALSTGNLNTLSKTLLVSGDNRN
ncbi:hypothetical protein M434DRAFT_395471 [Hypoxylon sp. CO27-5]|nr:hypothetical protein M434DRAFT_395471 [Hypoxylon sp. CO27-5]